MANFKKTCQSLVARSLVEEHEKLEEQLETQIKVTAEHRNRWVLAEQMIKGLKKEKRALRQENESLKGSDPLARSLDSARHNAAQTRIRDLEHQLRRNNIEPQ